MKFLTFDSQHLDVDWLSFNIQGLTEPKTIASNLSKYFTPHVLIDDVSSTFAISVTDRFLFSFKFFTF